MVLIGFIGVIGLIGEFSIFNFQFSIFNFQFSIDQANAWSKMLTLGIVCKQPLPSLTRICLNFALL